jgi:gluconokinase
MTRSDGPSGARLAVIVMGVSGCGKSTVAAGIAGRLGLHFVDGDGLHPEANVARMRAGIPLEDADRWPWLDRIGACLADAERWPRGLAVACSALRRIYRDRLRAAAPGVRFVFLDGAPEVIAGRMAQRSGHYMPPTLLASQLRTLERPGPDERDVQRVAIDAPAATVIEQSVLSLRS